MDSAIERTRRRRLITVYGIAHFGKSLLWNTSSLLFAFFLTEAVGLEPATMGYVLSASLLVNAVADVLVGRWLGQRVRSASSAAGAQLGGGVAASLAFALFAASGLVAPDLRLAYAIVTVLLFRLSYSFFDVPQNAYMSFACVSDRDRSALAATRYIAAGASILLIATVFAPVVREADPAERALRFVQVAIPLALAATACAWALWATKMPPGAAPIETAGARDASRRRVAFPLLLLGIFVLSFATPGFTKLEAYFAAYALQDAFTASAFMACVAGGKVAAQPLWAHLAGRTSLEAVFRIASIAMGLSAVAFGALGRIEPAGTLTSAVAFGAASGGVFMAIWGLLARSTALDPSTVTRRYGLFTFCSKTAQAASLLAIGALLGQFEYTDRAQNVGLSLTMTLAPLCGAAVLFLLSWRLGLRAATEPPPRGQL